VLGSGVTGDVLAGRQANEGGGPGSVALLLVWHDVIADLVFSCAVALRMPPGLCT
jgi:hypothetical protein